MVQATRKEAGLLAFTRSMKVMIGPSLEEQQVGNSTHRASHEGCDCLLYAWVDVL